MTMSGVSTVVGPEREVEVVAKAQRRRFTAEYKRRIVREADGCRKPGELGALLRREGLYSSHLAAWRAAWARGPRKRGPKGGASETRVKRVLELEREVRRLRARAERAEALVEVQKKLSVLLALDDASTEPR
jgi:transposase